MQAKKMLHQQLKKSCPQIHNTRLTALMDVVESLIYGKTLTVTGLGRSSLRDMSMKHSIKQSDRLIGNAHLYAERFMIYQTIAQQLIGNNQQPVLLIDWSDYTYNQNYFLLRASVPVGGRALTLYEEVHPQNAYGNARIQTGFLKTLQQILPCTCRPIIVTDAGFTGPWFRAVEAFCGQYMALSSESLSRWPASSGITRSRLSPHF